MASTADPGARRRWTRRRRRSVAGGWLAWTAGGLGLAVVLVGALLLAAHMGQGADPKAARRAMADALALYAQGNVSRAHARARDAVQEDPDWAPPHALLARLDLTAGDGAGAEAELDRARDAGFAPSRLHQLYADAWLQQGDAARADAEAKRALPRYFGYAFRVRARAVAANGDLPGGRAMLQDLIGIAPGDSLAWSDLARLRLQSGDVAGAMQATAQAIRLDHANLDAVTLGGELVRQQFGLAAALPWFQRVLAVDPGNHAALIDDAATLGDLGRNAAMLDATRRALAVLPGDPQAYYLQAVMAARAGRYDLARTLVQQAGGALGDMPGMLLLQGVLHLQAGEDQQAGAALGTLVDEQPLNMTARRLLGAALLRSGDADGALNVLKPLALRRDADPYTLALVARGFAATGQADWRARFVDRAAMPAAAPADAFGTDTDLPTLAEAADAAPGDPDAQVEYIKGLIDAGRSPMALARAAQLARIDAGTPAAQVLLGDMTALTGDYAGAADVYARAADLRFDEPTMLRLVDALTRTGRRVDAARALGLFLAQNPADVSARRIAADWQLAAHDWPAAIATLEGLRRDLGVRDAALLAALADAYVGAGDAQRARLYGAAAYRLAPMNPIVCDAYGWALVGAGDRAGGVQLLRKAATIAPQSQRIAAHLAAAQARG